MNFLLLLPPILSLTLIAGGAGLMLFAARAKRRLISARANRLAPFSFAGDSLADPGQSDDLTLLRVSVNGLNDSDLAQIVLIWKRRGISPERGPVGFMILRILTGLVVTLIVLALLHNVAFVAALGPLAVVALAPFLFALGWLAPLYLLRNLAKQRAKLISQGLAEALELLVVCVEAGLTLEDGMDRIIRELSRTQPDLAEELALTSAELRVLPDRNQAFANLAGRVASPNMRSVVNTLSQSLRYGTPLAGALRAAASQLRSDALVEMEERANRLPALLTVPMMLFIMPTIFLVVGGPAVLRLLDAFSR